MRASTILVCFLVLGIAQQANAESIDQIFEKPASAWTWRTIFSSATGLTDFDKSYALVVGINEYTQGFDQLDTTKNDPIRMRDFLLHEAGFDQVHVLTNAKATKARIEELMEDQLPRLIGPKDRFLFYWSGHGTQTTDADGVPLGYLPLTKSGKDSFSTMISMRDLSGWDRRIRARHALFLLDSCFSGLAGSEPKAGLAESRIAQLSKPAHHVISAGTGDEQTIASDSWGGSIFADAIIRGARGEADLSEDGIVSLYELMEYIQVYVDGERQRVGWNQSITPQMRYLRSDGGKFFFITRDKRADLVGIGRDVVENFKHGMPIDTLGREINNKEIPQKSNLEGSDRSEKRETINKLIRDWVE